MSKPENHGMDVDRGQSKFSRTNFFIGGCLKSILLLIVSASLLFGAIALLQNKLVLTESESFSEINSWFVVGTVILGTSLVAHFVLRVVGALWGYLAAHRPNSLLNQITQILSIQPGLTFREHLNTDGIKHKVSCLASQLPRIFQHLFGILGIILVVPASVALFSIMLAMAQFLTSRLQVERMTQQNALIVKQNLLLTTQNNLLKDSTDTQYEVEVASKKLREIQEILLNPDSAIEAQVYAIRQIPAAMIMPVSHIDSETINKTEVFVEYPNHSPLKELLLQFMRRDRIKQRLSKSGIEWSRSGKLPPRAAEHLREFEPVSTEVLKTLHILGPTGYSVGVNSDVWSFSPNGFNRVPRLRKIEPGKVTISNTLISYVGEMVELDLRYLDTKTFHDAQLPFAMNGYEAIRILFPRGSEFERCHFEGWRPLYILAEDAEFRNARLDRSWFELGSLKGSSFYNTNFDGSAWSVNLSKTDFRLCEINAAWWTNGNLQLSSFVSSTCGNTNFSGTTFEGAQISSVDFCKSTFIGANFEAIEVSNSSFIACRFDQSKMSQGVWDNIELDCSIFREVNFVGSTLSSVFLSGSEIVDCNFSGASLNDIRFGGRELYFSTDVFNVPDYKKHPPDKLYTVRSVASGTRGRIDVLDSRDTESIKLIRINSLSSNDEEAKWKKIDVPGAVIWGNTTFGIPVEFCTVKLSGAENIKCEVYEKMSRVYLPDSRIFHYIFEIAEEKWERTWWSLDEADMLFPGAPRITASRGGFQNAIDDPNGDFFHVGTPGLSAWLGQQQVTELTAMSTQIRADHEDSAMALDAILRAANRTESRSFEERSRWTIDSAIENY